MNKEIWQIKSDEMLLIIILMRKLLKKWKMNI